MRACRCEPPGTTLEQREVTSHVRETRLVTGGTRAIVDDAKQLARLVGLVGPDVCTRQRRSGAQVRCGDEAIALRAHRLAQRRATGTGLHPGVELCRRGERPDAQIGIVGVAQQSERLLGAVACLLRAPRELQAEREHEQAPHARFPVVAFGHRRPTQRDALVQPRVLVTADGHERSGVAWAGRQLVGGLPEQLEGMVRTPRLLVALPRRHQPFAVCVDVLGEMSRALLCVLDDRGEPGMDLPAAPWRHGGQRGDRREGRERCPGERREPVADEPPDLRQVELHVRARRLQATGLGRPRELQGDEGVAAGQPLDAPERGSRQAMAELVGDAPVSRYAAARARQPTARRRTRRRRCRHARARPPTHAAAAAAGRRPPRRTRPRGDR